MQGWGDKHGPREDLRAVEWSGASRSSGGGGGGFKSRTMVLVLFRVLLIFIHETILIQSMRGVISFSKKER